MKTRGQKALINTAVLGIYQIVSFICGLILPRYILKCFGSDYNGISSSITHFLGFIAILQVGIAGSTRFALYKVLADEDNDGISGIVNATEKYMRKVGMALLAYIVLMVLFYPHIANTTLPHKEISLLVLILSAHSFAQYFFGITYQILLTADQRQYIYNIIVTIAAVVNVLIAVLLMNAGYNIFIVKFGSALIYVFVPIILSVYVRKRYSINKKIPPNKAGLKSRWDVMWHSLANIVHNNVSLVVLTVFADVKLLSVYTVYYLVINGIYKILSIFTNSLEAAFGNMFAKKEINVAYKHLETYEFFMCSFVSVVFSCTLALIIPFVKLYTTGVNDVNYIEPAFAFFAVIAQMVLCIRQPYLSVVQAAGHYKQTRNGAFVEAGLNLLITLALTPVLGLVGVALGTLSANLFRTLQYAFYLSKNIVFRPVKKSLQMMLWTCVNVGIVTLICQCVINYIGVSTWFMWVVTGFICFAISLVINILSAFIFCREKLLMLINTLKNMLGKKRIKVS